MYNNENENENVVLCASNSYEKKYYFNPDFDKLPEDIKNELKIMCVLYVNDVGLCVCYSQKKWEAYLI